MVVAHVRPSSGLTWGIAKMSSMNTSVRGMIVLLSLLVGAALPQTARQQIPFSFVIDAPNQVQSGSPITVRVTITNTSKATIGLDEMEVSPYIGIVRGADGILTPETEQGRKIKEKQKQRVDPNFVASRFASPLGPGKSVTAECVVSKLYDMSVPGKYSIQLERIWGRNVIPSNTITVNVVK